MDGALRRAFFQRFVDAVAERLDQGERQYRGRTFELPASSIIAEAQAELLDNAAYSFIAWVRLERLRDEIERVEGGLQPVTDQEQAGGTSPADSRVPAELSREPVRAARSGVFEPDVARRLREEIP